jgi:hypothetical protein
MSQAVIEACTSVVTCLVLVETDLMANSTIYLPTSISFHTVTLHAPQLLCMMGPLEIFVVLDTAQVTDIGYCYSNQADICKASTPEYRMFVALYGRKVAFISKYDCEF